MPDQFKSFFRSFLASDGSNGKLIIVSAILALLIFTVIFNYSFLNLRAQKRGIASRLQNSTMSESHHLGITQGANTLYAPSVEKSFIKRLSQLHNTGKVEYAKKPSKIDKLRFELLQGKYNLFQVDKKIQRLRLNIGEEGVAIKNPSQFLANYRDLLIEDNVSFRKLENRTFKRDISSSFRIESYEIVQAGNLKGRLDFEFGVDGNLLEVQIHWL